MVSFVTRLEWGGSLKHNHTKNRQTFAALFSVEGDLDDVWSGVPWSECHGKLSFVDRTCCVRHTAVIHCDLQLSFAGPTYIH